MRAKNGLEKRKKSKLFDWMPLFEYSHVGLLGYLLFDVTGHMPY